jgi:hypothetical protein
VKNIRWNTRLGEGLLGKKISFLKKMGVGGNGKIK